MCYVHRSKRLTPGTLRSYFRRPPKVNEVVRLGGSSVRDSGEPFAFLARAQTRLSRGVKGILMTGITVTTLLTSVATASAQNIFEALFGQPSPVTVPDANFTARDRQQLANPPYQQAWILPAYRRQIVQYQRKEAPGSILVDTDRRYLYYVLPKGKAVRYGAIVGEDAQAWSGVATVGRKANGRDGRRPRVRSGGLARFRTMSKAVPAIQWVRARCTFTPAARTHCTASTERTSPDGSDMRFRRAASG